MGIKFYCPNGHKVNVKSFLAGKKGLCPKCGVRVDIPLESQIADDAPRERGAAADDELQESPEPFSANVGSARALAGIEQGDEFSTGVDIPRMNPQGRNSGGNGFNEREPVADDLLLPPGSESNRAYSGDAVWHVRLANGQQIGPLDDVGLQQWISEGQLGDHDLIWRNGWPQWQPATAVLSQLPQPEQEIEPLGAGAAAGRGDDPLMDAVQATVQGSSTNWFTQRHRGKKEIRARLSLVLLGLIVLLFALLLYIFAIRKQPDESKSQTSLLNAHRALVVCPARASTRV
jgi:hypothetical protein